MTGLEKLPNKTTPLAENWRVWYTDENKKAKTYEDRIHDLGSFASVEEMWAWLGSLKSPAELPVSTDYHIFKEGIMPMWEHDQNRSGGKWILRIKKLFTARLWESLVLAIVGRGAFTDAEDLSNDVCGIVVSVRHGEDSISVWHKSGRNFALRTELVKRIKHALELPEDTHLDYKTHDAALMLHNANKQQHD